MSTSIQDIPKCQRCGALQHEGMCPRIKAIDYYQDGTTKRVEYHEPPELQPPSITRDDAFDTIGAWLGETQQADA